MRKLILLADESATVQQLVKLAFADEAIEVQSAPSVSAARDFLDQRTPDLILVDPALQDGDVPGLLRSIRANLETSRIPVVLLNTASTRLERGMGSDIDAVLTKPFESIALLVTTVKDLLNRRSLVPEPASLTEISQYSLDEIERSDMILEIEDVVEWGPPADAAEPNAILASMPAELMEALADKVAAILLERLRERTQSERQPSSIRDLLGLPVNEHDHDESKNTGDIDEPIENPDH